MIRTAKPRYAKRIIILFAALAAMAISAGSLSAAISLSGTVTDAATGQFLEGATVTVGVSDQRGTATEMMTGKDGLYQFSNLQSGNYTLIVSFVGFGSRVTKVNFTSGQAIELDISLTPSAVNLDAISVTASRRPEKILEAPASVSVVSAAAIQERASFTPVDHIKGLPAVDVATTGLHQSNVVVRGFNNIFSGQLLVMTDNRLARVPSLRYNAYSFIPTTNEDIERIEIVSGPGSALYGPNSAGGVMHIITKSPFNSQGTSVTLGGGEREVGMVSFRHAGVSNNNRIGYKVTGRYYKGKDWYHTEPLEKLTRDFEVKKISAEGRLDFLINDNTSLIFNSGFNQSSGIELTGLGAGQAVNWLYSYGQARLTYKDLYVQTFVNMSDAGDTYLLNSDSANAIVDNSKLWVAQVQHSYKVSDRQNLTYGFDALFTRPSSSGSINGRNEDDDDINELGVYLQSETRLSDQFKLVTAARLDDNNRLKDMVFSPRAAIVYKMNAENNFRVTYNRAYSTPDNNNLFLDLLTLRDLGDIGAGFAPVLGFSPGFDIRAQGVPETGFHWSTGDSGPKFRSPFAPLDPRSLTSSDFIDFNDPIFTNVMWSAGRGAVISGFEQQLIDLETPQASIDALLAAVNAIAPTTVSTVQNTLMIFNPNTTGFVPFSASDLTDIERLEPTITQTAEFGYKGVVNKRLALSVDLYYTKKNDFVGPLAIETPNVFLDPATLQQDIGTQFATDWPTFTGADSAALMQLDLVQMGGNGNGSPVDELTAMFTQGGASIPFGTVSPNEALDPTAIMVTYRNFGDIDFFGTDFGFDYHLDQRWSFGGSYSWVSKIFWEKSGDQPFDINLNAPQHKVSANLRYINPSKGLSASVRARWVDSFKMAGPFLGTFVPAYKVFDLNVSYEFITDTRLSLTIQNILDDSHIEFVGGANLGRLSIIRLTRTF